MLYKETKDLHEERKKMKIVMFLIFIVFEAILAIVYLPAEYAYVTSEKTQGVISSERYTDSSFKLFSDRKCYFYTVEYEVNGQKYVSTRYESAEYTLNKGDVVTVHYKVNHPEEAVYVSFPVVWLVMLVSTIYVVYKVFFDTAL